MSKRKCGNCRWCVYENYERYCNFFRRKIYDNSEANGCPNYTGW